VVVVVGLLTFSEGGERFSEEFLVDPAEIRHENLTFVVAVHVAHCQQEEEEEILRNYFINIPFTLLSLSHRQMTFIGLIVGAIFDLVVLVIVK
jgi:hypothetical protein